MTTTTTRTVTLPGIGPVDVTVTDYGDGQPFCSCTGAAARTP